MGDDPGAGVADSECVSGADDVVLSPTVWDRRAVADECFLGSVRTRRLCTGQRTSLSFLVEASGLGRAKARAALPGSPARHPRRSSRLDPRFSVIGWSVLSTAPTVAFATAIPSETILVRLAAGSGVRGLPDPLHDPVQGDFGGVGASEAAVDLGAHRRPFCWRRG